MACEPRIKYTIQSIIKFIYNILSNIDELLIKIHDIADIEKNVLKCLYE